MVAKIVIGPILKVWFRVELKKLNLDSEKDYGAT